MADTGSLALVRWTSWSQRSLASPSLAKKGCSWKLICLSTSGGQYDHACCFCYSFFGARWFTFSPEAQGSQGLLSALLKGTCQCNRNPIHLQVCKKAGYEKIIPTGLCGMSENTLSVPKFKCQLAFYLKSGNSENTEQFHRIHLLLNEMENIFASLRS